MKLKYLEKDHFTPKPTKRKITPLKSVLDTLGCKLIFGVLTLSNLVAPNTTNSPR